MIRIFTVICIMACLLSFEKLTFTVNTSLEVTLVIIFNMCFFVFADDNLRDSQPPDSLISKQ